MRRNDWKQALAVMAALLMGCAGTADPVEAAGGADGGPGLAFGDSGSGPWYADSGAGQTFPDSAPLPAADGAASCPFGNLLPTLCRPFAATQASPLPPEPPGCKDLAQVSGTTGTYTGTDDGRDHVQGLDGDDVITGLGCNDELSGNQGNDTLNGNQGNDTLRGGSGKDIIHGGAGHDTIWGGGGDDAIWGGGGDDLFYYSEGAGNDVIQEYSGRDAIVCAPNGTSPKARVLSWSQLGGDLYLSMSGGGSITVKGYFTSPDNAIEAIVGCE